jgi:glucose-1-phosphate cytidylyltransferase
MKVVILAGGLGTRFAEETDVLPKPLIEIGDRPMLWHIMQLYAHFGLKEFVICCGYKGRLIKRYFADYARENSDLIVDLGRGTIEYLQPQIEDWRVTIVDTGINTMTGGRVRRALPHVGNETFCLTYGDGLADIDIAALIAFHKERGRLATITAVPSPGRFGILSVQADQVCDIREKPDNEMGLINGGFFVLEPRAVDYVAGDSTSWEREPLERLARDGQLSAYVHSGFWKPMDTLRDKRELERLWAENCAPWKRV